MMKKFLCSVICILLICPFIKAGTPIAIVKGKMNEFRFGKLVLWKVTEGEKKEVSSFQNDPSKEFVFAVPVAEEGFYYLTDQTRWWQVRMYLKPGEQLELAINYSGHYDVLKGSIENKLLQEWNQFASSVLYPAYNFGMDTTGYPVFFDRVHTLLITKDNFRKKINTSSLRFNALMNLIVENDIEHAALRYCFTPLRNMEDTSSVKAEMREVFLRQFIRPAKFCDAGILSLGEGVDLLQLYASAATDLIAGNGSKKDYSDNLAKTCDLFCNDTLKGAFIVSRLQRYKFYDELSASIDPVKQFLVTAYQQSAYAGKLKSLDSSLVKGNPGCNFSFPDNKGNIISMSDFKGKVVLIDTWATWCKPCIGEIPALKKLADEFKGKDITFVSISFDETKDKGKWEKFLDTEKLEGIQLFAGGFNNKISEVYKINSIPRFLLFDRAGKIVSVDAPRPSDPALKQMIDKILN